MKGLAFCLVSIDKRLCGEKVRDGANPKTTPLVLRPGKRSYWNELHFILGNRRIIYDIPGYG